MKPITSSLTALFATRQYRMCGLYEFDLIGGSSLYYASADMNIYLASSQSGGDAFWNNQTFTTGAPLFDKKDNRAKLQQKIGTQVSQLMFDVIPGSSQVLGEAFLSACRTGVFDGAVLTYLGAYWPTSSLYAPTITPTGTIKKFVGRVAEVDMGRNLATFTVNSHLELLNIQFPRNLYQSPCTNILYDAGCTLAQSSCAISSGVVSSGSTSSLIYTSVAPSSGLSLALGQITFTSGALNGISRQIQAFSSGIPNQLTIVPPFPSSPSSGDTFTVYPGCDKTSSTCGLFSNIAHFRGEPYIPVPDTAI